jgi:hypothetical protein
MTVRELIDKLILLVEDGHGGAHVLIWDGSEDEWDTVLARGPRIIENCGETKRVVIE